MHCFYASVILHVCSCIYIYMCARAGTCSCICRNKRGLRLSLALNIGIIPSLGWNFGQAYALAKA